MFGISVRGWTTLPPAASIFFIASSIPWTSIVITGALVSGERRMMPPLIAPGSVGRIRSSTGTVVTVVYMPAPPMSMS